MTVVRRKQDEQTDQDASRALIETLPQNVEFYMMAVKWTRIVAAAVCENADQVFVDQLLKQAIGVNFAMEECPGH